MRPGLAGWTGRRCATGCIGSTRTAPRGSWTPGPKALSRASRRSSVPRSQLVETGPDRAVHGLARWRRIDLQRVILERFGVTYHERTVGKLLKALGFSHISARPRHPAQDARTIETFKKRPRHSERSSRRHRRQEVRGDLVPEPAPDLIGGRGADRPEERLGAPVGATRPRQPADQRYESAYLFGAICPARGTGAALALPFADTDAMQLHLDEIARTVKRGAHAVLLLDRAGWHTTGALNIPKNITMILLPSRAPELNPVENIWQYLRQTWLSNRVFDTYDEIIDAACDAWRRLIAQPRTITSIGSREWALAGQR